VDIRESDTVRRHRPTSNGEGTIKTFSDTTIRAWLTAVHSMGSYVKSQVPVFNSAPPDAGMGGGGLHIHILAFLTTTPFGLEM
jgi:hypothetical protein